MFTENSSPSQRILFERVFEALAAGQRERFAVDGSFQRSDSFQAMSNIADFGRLRLLVEVLRRLVRIFDDADNQRFQELIEPYTAHSSTNYVYRVEEDNIPRELNKLADVYAELAGDLAERYENHPQWFIFERVLAHQSFNTAEFSDGLSIKTA